MMSRKTVLVATTAGALVLAGAGAALAATAPIALDQAINAAESATGAKAVRATYERQGRQDVVKVRLVKGGKVVASTVDAATGKVLKTSPSIREQGDENEPEGNEPGEPED